MKNIFFNRNFIKSIFNTVTYFDEAEIISKLWLRLYILKKRVKTKHYIFLEKTSLITTSFG